MTTFTEYLDCVKPVVDEKIEAVARKKLRDEYLVQLLVRGKRLRAGLLSLVFESTCGRKFTGTLDLACAVELAHSASLIIDDMLDEDELRRGMPTVHTTEGQKRAMLDTVGILSLPYDLVVPYGERYVQSLADTQRSMVSGVLKEVMKDPKMSPTKVYDTIIMQKTGMPFGLASSWGYLAGLNGRKNGGNGHLNKWKAYGLHVGKAMQIADDMTDLGEVLRTRKMSGYGSELLLLRCVTAERLAKELFCDIRRMTPHFEKAKELWSSDGIQESLKLMLLREIDAAQTCVLGLELHSSADRDMLISAPEEIAKLMLVEK
jgi:geranylgeranyl diphosphate synthase type II